MRDTSTTSRSHGRRRQMQLQQSPTGAPPLPLQALLQACHHLPGIHPTQSLRCCRWKHSCHDICQWICRSRLSVHTHLHDDARPCLVVKVLSSSTSKGFHCVKLQQLLFGVGNARGNLSLPFVCDQNHSSGMHALQVLLAVYSFLAGVAVTKRRLWLMPMASASFAVLALVVAALSRPILPRYRWGLVSVTAHCVKSDPVFKQVHDWHSSIWRQNRPAPEDLLSFVALICVCSQQYSLQRWQGWPPLVDIR